jgi:hypothetical protein
MKAPRTHPLPRRVCSPRRRRKPWALQLIESFVRQRDDRCDMVLRRRRPAADFDLLLPRDLELLAHERLQLQGL